MVDWQAIKAEYITTNISYRKLAEKHGVHYRTIASKGKEENWKALREQSAHRMLTKSVKKIEEQKARKVAKVDNLADELLIKLEQAIGELDQTAVTHKTKTREIEYGDRAAPGKPTKEIIQEEEKILAMESVVDRGGLRLLAAALKDLKEVKGILSDLDKQEKKARIENLRRQAVQADASGGSLTVELEGGLDEYAK